MPRIAGSGSNRLLLSLVVVVLMFGFTPISNFLLRSVHGSFAPTAYSALALRNTSDATSGIPVGEPVRVYLTNRTGRNRTYHWSATQLGAVISHGEEALDNGQTTTISVPSRGASTGALRIALTGTNVFITVPILVGVEGH
jgi:hypothetical protein